MALFGPSKKKKYFVKKEAVNLANFIKNNAVKFGGEAYARLQISGEFPKDINKEVLWLFWVSVFSFRTAKDLGYIREEYGDEIYGDVMLKFIDIDKNHFSKLSHKPFRDVFSYIGSAADIIYHSDLKEPIKQASAFFLSIAKEIPITLNEQQRFIVVKELLGAVNSFPPLEKIIKKMHE